MKRPIPRRLLIHSAIFVKPETKDKYGKVTGSTDVTLKRVRYEPTNKVVKSSTNKELKLNALLFFDVRNSLPIGTTFDTTDDIDKTITFNGNDHRIMTIELIYDDSDLHHYEIGLI